MLFIFAGILLLLGTVPLLWWSLAGGRTSNVAGETPDLQQAVLQLRALPRLIVPSVDALGRFLRRVTPIGMHDKLEQKIAAAGLQGRWNGTTALAVKALATGTGAGLGFLILVKAGGGYKGIAGFVLFAFLGFKTLDSMLDSRGNARREQMEQKLPDVLDQMSVCVEAGLGFDAALLRASSSCGGALGEELGRTMQDIRLGATRNEALQNLLDRSIVPELRMFTRAMIQADKTGVPVARVLRIQSEDARERRRQRAEERAMKLPVKMIFPLVSFILPSLFIIVLGPAVMNIMKTGLGA